MQVLTAAVAWLRQSARKQVQVVTFKQYDDAVVSYCM